MYFENRLFRRLAFILSIPILLLMSVAAHAGSTVSPVVTKINPALLKGVADASLRAGEMHSVDDYITNYAIGGPAPGAALVPHAAKSGALQPHANGNPGPNQTPFTVTSTVQSTDITLSSYQTTSNALTTDDNGFPTQAAPVNIDPVWSSNEQFIVFASNRTSATNPTPNPLGVFHLYALTASGYSGAGSLVQLTGLTAADEYHSQRWPSLAAPDDATLVYCNSTEVASPGPPAVTIDVDDDTYQLTVASFSLTANPPTSGQTPYDTTMYVQHPSISGDLIVFAGRSASSPTGASHDIYTVNLEGTAVNQVTSAGNVQADNLDPSFAPNGSLIAFDSNASTFSTPGASGAAMESNGPLTSNRNIFVGYISGSDLYPPSGHVGAVAMCSSAYSNIQPSWTRAEANPLINPFGNQEYIFFSSNRVTDTANNSPHYSIYYLQAYQTSGESEVSAPMPETGTNPAIEVDVSDPTHQYDNYEPTVSTLQSALSVGYTSNRFLVNGLQDNPELGPNFVGYSKLNNTTITTLSAPPGSIVPYTYPVGTTMVYVLSVSGLVVGNQYQIGTAGDHEDAFITNIDTTNKVITFAAALVNAHPAGDPVEIIADQSFSVDPISGGTAANPIANLSELFTSHLADIDPPSLVRYNDAADEIMHVEQVSNPGVDVRYVPAGQSAIIYSRVSDRQTGVNSVWLQVKDPNSKYQDQAGLEHKVYSSGYNSGEAATLASGAEAGSGITLQNGFLQQAAPTENGIGVFVSQGPTSPPSANTVITCHANPWVPSAIMNLNVGQWMDISYGTGQAQYVQIVSVFELVIVPGPYNEYFVTVTGGNGNISGPNPGDAIDIFNQATVAGGGGSNITVSNSSGLNIGDVVAISSGNTPGSAWNGANYSNDAITFAQIASVEANGSLDLIYNNGATGAVAAGEVVNQIETLTRYNFGQEVDCQALVMNAPSPFNSAEYYNFVNPAYTPGADDSNILSATNPAYLLPETSYAGISTGVQVWQQMTPVMTTTAAAISAGATSFSITDVGGIQVGDELLIGKETGSGEDVSVTGITITAPAGSLAPRAGTITVVSAGAGGMEGNSGDGGGFVYNHLAGESVVVNGLYSTIWQTPSVPSDYYFDLITYDNASFPVASEPYGAYSGNWKIYDNIWGMTTANLATNNGVLVVDDYALPQKFFNLTNSLYNPSNVPPNYYGAESYVTDIETDFIDPNYYNHSIFDYSNWRLSGETPTFPPCATPKYVDTTVSGNETVTPITQSETESAHEYEAGVPVLERPLENPFFFGTAAIDSNYGSSPIIPELDVNNYNNYLPVYENGLGVNSVVDTNMTSVVQNASTDYLPIANSQRYSVWRILSRGPITSQVLSNYVTQYQTQPTDPVSGKTPGNGGQVAVSSGCVIWVTPQAGNEFAAPGTIVDPNTITTLTNFISNGGRILIEGQNIGFALTNNIPGAANAFYNDELNVESYNGEGPVGALGQVAEGADADFLAVDAYGAGAPVSHDAAFGGYPPNPLQISFVGAGYSDGSPDNNNPDQYTANATANIEFGTADGPQLIYSPKPSPAGTNGSIVGYSNFGIEGVSQVLKPDIATGGVPRSEVENIRSNLLHNIICYMRTGTLTGQVTLNNNAGQPVAGAIVVATGGPNDNIFTSTSASDGTFAINGLQPGEYSIYASKVGYTTVHSSGTVTIHGGDFGSLSLIMTQIPPGSIKVVYVDATTNLPPTYTNGSVISISTTASLVTNPFDLQPYTQNSDVTGTALFDNLLVNDSGGGTQYVIAPDLTGVPYIISSVNPGLTVSVTSGVETTITVYLQPVGTINVLVETSAGPPPVYATATQGVAIGLYNSPSGAATTFSGFGGNVGSPPPPYSETFTDVPIGNYTVKASSGQLGTGVSPIFTLGKSDTSAGNVVETVVLSQSGSLVVDLTNIASPATSVTTPLQVTVSNGTVSQTLLNTTGTLNFTLPNGTYTITVGNQTTYDFFALQVTGVNVSSSTPATATVDLYPIGNLTIKLEDSATGLPILAAIPVTLSTASGNIYQGETSLGPVDTSATTGSVTFDNITAGVPYTVTVDGTAENFGLVSDLPVAPNPTQGATNTFVVTLSPVGSIEIDLFDAVSGSGIDSTESGPNITVTATAPGRAAVTAPAAATGSNAVEFTNDLVAGVEYTFTANATAAGYLNLPTVTATPETNVTIQVPMRLDPFTNLDVSVIDGVTGALVSLPVTVTATASGTGQAQLGPTTNATGTFDYPNVLAEMTYTATANGAASGYNTNSATTPTPPAPGSTTSLPVTLTPLGGIKFLVTNSVSGVALSGVSVSMTPIIPPTATVTQTPITNQLTTASTGNQPNLTISNILGEIQYNVTVNGSAINYSTAQLVVTVPIGSNYPTVDVKLDPAGQINVTVEDSFTLQPISTPIPLQAIPPATSGRTTLSGATVNGQYTFNVTAGLQYTISAVGTAAGYGSAQQTAQASTATPASVTLYLDHISPLTVNLVDSTTGQPVTAPVTVTPVITSTGFTPQNPLGPQSTSTGSVVFANGVIGPTYTFTADGSASGYNVVSVTGIVLPQPNNTLTISLTPIGTINVFLVDASTGLPINTGVVSVTATNATINKTYGPQATSTGSTTFSNLVASGSYTINADGSEDGYGSASQSITLTRGQNEDVTLALAALTSLTVTVTDATTGNLVTSGVTITATGTGGSPVYGPLPIGSNGNVTFPSVQAGTYTVTADGTVAGYGIVSLNNQTVSRGVPASVQILVVPVGSLAVQVLDAATGQPIASQLASLITVTATNTSGSPAPYGPLPLGGSGSVTFSSTQVGTYDITVNGSAAEYSNATQDGVAVTRGGSTSISVTLAAQASAIIGTITINDAGQSDNGQPISGATVRLAQSGGSTVTTTTAADGSYSFVGLSAGVYSISASASGYATSAAVALTVGRAQNLVQNISLIKQATTTTLHSFAAGLQMFSVPYDYSSSGLTLSQVLSGDSSPLLAVWEPTLNEYSLTPNYPADQIRLGQGYWVRFPNTVNITTAGTAAPSSGSYPITLYQGWNMVGDPFTASTLVSNATVTDSNGNVVSFANATGADNLISPTYYSYSPAIGNYVSHYVGNPSEPSPTVDPWVGYWFYAQQTVSLLLAQP